MDEHYGERQRAIERLRRESAVVESMDSDKLFQAIHRAFTLIMRGALELEKHGLYRVACQLRFHDRNGKLFLGEGFDRTIISESPQPVGVQ